ncbi:MAG: hypothetical protein PHI66_05370 [Candidatus Pacebacteria bacterium]|nr:hypothetical protein [Candidatus Paceibacterota bacterium]
MKNNIKIKTLTRKDVERLSGRSEIKNWAISFYLGVRGDRNFLSVANSVISGQKKELESREFSKDERVQISGIFKTVEDFLRISKLPDRTRAFAMFFSDGGVSEVYGLPVYIPTKLVLERNFFIHPFVKKNREYPRYAVLSLERDRAKIFSFFWGELKDSTGEIRSEVPQRMNAARATWRGLEEGKIQNHIEVHINRHLKKVARAVEKYMEKEKIPYLVIGSRKELIERFSRELSDQVRRKIVGSYFVRSDQSLGRIREKSLEVIDGFELRKEEGVVQKIFEGNSKKDRSAVLGAEAVLENLENYKVRNLVIGENFVGSGYVCAKDRKIYLNKGKCELCGDKLSEVGDIADEMIEVALMQKIKVTHFLHSHDDFDKFGVGAILK